MTVTTDPLTGLFEADRTHSSFFDADNHPEILFRSERVELAENGSATIDGQLTIKGISRPITATGTYQRPVEDPYGSLRAALELRTVLDRRDWGMSWQQPLPDGADAVGWDVELTVQLELVKLAGGADFR